MWRNAQTANRFGCMLRQSFLLEIHLSTPRDHDDYVFLVSLVVTGSQPPKLIKN
jgi:hypothetical protein